MWVPDHFSAGAPDWDADVIDAHPFGLLVTGGGAGPVATHVPMRLHPDDRAHAAHGLVGARVLGHLARANDQWRAITDGDRVLLVFQGPDGYVSPTAYPDEPAAPTWNYVAVHVRGPIHLIHEPEAMMDVIDRTIDAVEHPREVPWDREPSRPYFERIIGGVVAFEVEVAEVVSTYKLSQDQPPHRRRVVAEAGRVSDDPAHRALAAWMRRAGSDG